MDIYKLRFIKEANVMKKILIPIDGSDFSKRAMEKGKELAKAFDSEVVLMHVTNFDFVTYPGVGVFEVGVNIPDIMEELEEQGEKLLQEAKESFGDMKGKVETLLQKGGIAHMITEYCENNDVDMVVMGSEGLSASGIRSLLIGSVTSKVIHHVNVPVLVVK